MFAIGRMPEGHVQSTASVVPVPAAFSIETQWSMIGIRNEDIQFQNRNDTSRYTINPRVIETKKLLRSLR